MPPNPAGMFKPGNPGGPGRPKGARSRLGEAFLADMLTAFTEANERGTSRGLDAIRAARDTDPGGYIRALVAILPKEVTGENGEPLLTGINVTFVRPPKIKE